VVYGDFIMTTTQTTTKISKETLGILKNFASINSNILVKSGNVLTTISPVKNVMAKATVNETFSSEFGIWDLNKFLGTVSLFESPEFEFDEKNVRISNGSSEVVYYYSEPKLLTVPSKEITMPEGVLTFTLKQTDLNELQKASSIMQLSDMVVRSDGDKVQIAVLDKKDTTSNIYSLEVGDLPHGDHNFEFYFKVENLKMIPGDYDVIISEKNISQLNNTKDNIVYWIALETDSYYNE
jgi:hypothetical protein|tara:strand:+ start:94 stop:807 length:714 start_codon:yes stop_codon:yes gene_type:complete